MKSILCTLIALSCLAASSALAQEKETFKLHNPDAEIPEGTTFDATATAKLDKTKITMSVLGQEIDGTMSMSLDEKYSFRVLGKHKLVSVIKASKINTKMNMAGENHDEDLPNPLLGKKILSEKIDGKWQVKLVKGEPDAEEKELLELLREATEEQEKNFAIVYKDKDYKVGDVISVRVPLYSMFGLGDEIETERASLKIDRVEDLDGLRCAVLKGKLSSRSKMTPDEDIQEGASVINGEVTIWRSIDYSTDMKVEFVGTMDQSMRLAGGAGVMNSRGGAFKAVQEMKVRKKK